MTKMVFKRLFALLISTTLQLFALACGRKVCKGVVEPEYVNYSNIKRFEGCTKIEGNIIIVGATFDGDPYLNIMGIHPDSLEVFSSVQDITGYLVVQGQHPDFKNLSYFRNLTRIRGKQTSFQGDSFSIVATSLESIGLTSLKTVRRGDIIIANNKKLCYTDKAKFRSLTRRRSQKVIVTDNEPNKKCFLQGKLCSPLCSRKGCWGPGHAQCIERRMSNDVMDWLL